MERTKRCRNRETIREATRSATELKTRDASFVSVDAERGVVYMRSWQQRRRPRVDCDRVWERRQVWRAKGEGARGAPS